MRELLFDLSADSYLHQSEFAGFEGEHNATRITLLLPERLQVDGAEFYMVFELLKSKETIFSAPLFMENKSLTLDLPRQLMSSPGTSVYAAAYRREGKSLSQIAKSGKVFLEIKEPEDGILVAYSAQGGSAPGLVIENEIVPQSKNPVSSDAAYRAMEKFAVKEDVKIRFSSVEKTIASLKTKDEKIQTEILELEEEDEKISDAVGVLEETSERLSKAVGDLEEDSAAFGKTVEALEEEKEKMKKEISSLQTANDNLEKAVLVLEGEKERLEGELSDVKEENDLLLATTGELNERIKAQKDEILSNVLIGNEKGKNAVRLDDVSPLKHEIGVKLSAETKLVKVLEDFETELSKSGFYTVTEVGERFILLDNAAITDPYEGVKVGDFVYAEVESYGRGIALYLQQTISDFSTVTLEKKGKNLFYCSAAKSATNGGITVNLEQGSSSFVADGTATEDSAIPLSSGIPLKAGTYTVSLHGANVTSAASYMDRIYIQYTNESGTKVTVNNIIDGIPRTFTMGIDAEVNVTLVFKSGSAYENKEIGIQIELGSTATEYEEYKESTTYTPNADGTVEGIVGDGDVITLMTDNEGVTITIEAEYCRDIRGVIERIENAIVAIGGNV